MKGGFSVASRESNVFILGILNQKRNLIPNEKGAVFGFLKLRILTDNRKPFTKILKSRI